MGPEQLGEVVDGARGQRQTALVDKRAGVLGELFGIRHTIPTSTGGDPVTRVLSRSEWRCCWSKAGGEPAVGQFPQPAAIDESDQLAA